MQLKARPTPFITSLDMKAPARWQADSIELSESHLAQNLVVGFDPHDDRAQPFFRMRSQLLKHVDETGNRVFAVTSVQPGNGKTHVAINLAAALSRISPTMLIELDLHRPTVGERLGLSSAFQGIDDFLDGGCAWQHGGVHVGGSDLTVYRVRDPRDGAESLLTNPRMGEFFEHMRAHRSRPICIVDTPPAIVGDDIMLIRRVIDGLLMVVQEARTPRRALRETLRALSPTPIVGSILNMSIASAPPKDGYGYYNRARDNGSSSPREPKYL